MNLLALDTATPLVSVALWRDGELAASDAQDAERRHGERLAPAVAAVLDAAGLAVGDLDALAVDVGPGLFTGLRVGVATAKGLAAARRLPVVAVTSLEALAWPWRHDARLLLAAVDARRGEAFAQLSISADDPSAPRRPLDAAAAVAPDSLADLVRSADGPAGVLAVGDGARRYADALAGTGAQLGPEHADRPDAATWVPLAARRVAAGEVTDARSLAATYLRGADVRIGWSQRVTGRPS